MKRKLHVIVLFLPILLLAEHSAQGQMDRHVASPESMEISLNGLKQSAKQMAQRNQWLASEIKVLGLKIDSVQKRTSMTGRSWKTAKGQTHKSEKIVGASLDIANDARTEHKKRLLREIAVLEEEIESMNHLINQESGRSAPTGNELGRLQPQMETAQMSVSALEKRIQVFDKQHSKALERFTSLKEKNRLLKQKYNFLSGDLKKAQTAEKDAMDAMKGMETQNSKIIGDLHKEISELRSEGSSLDRILSKANVKIKERNTVFEITDEDIERLMENYSFIENENKALKDKYARIQENLKKLEQPAQNQ